MKRSEKKCLAFFAVLIQVVALLYSLTVKPVLAEDQSRQSKSGFTGNKGFGGPTSVGEQLHEDDELKEPAFRFPGFDAFFTPWFEWKKKLNEHYGLQLGFDYNALYQGANNMLPGNENNAASGAVRFFGRWTLLGRDTETPGALVFKVENRHRLGTDIPPSQLGFDLGYNGITGTLFSDVDTVLVDLNWQQAFNGGRGGFIIGRFDPNDYMDVSGHANPWTTFSNLSVLVNTSIALPDSSAGIGLGHWINDQWFVLGGLNDANGVIDEVEFFEHGSEFFTFVELGWTLSREQRYTNHVHVTFWHVDEREEVGVPESEGIAIGANWTVVEEWMIFGRLGWSDGIAPLANTTTTAGVMYRFFKRDLLGIGFNWSDPSNDDLRDQYSTEVFYRFQFAQNLALTPSLQWLVDPALNPEEDQIFVWGLRMRLTL
jgi:porin